MRVAIVGTGLIGASIGLASKSAGVEMVVGFDQDPESLRVASERGALDEEAASVEEAVSGAELAFVATPVATLVPQVGAALAASGDCTVSDVG
jgi:prephenate dehydrogenase